MMAVARPRLGISACLLGSAVRFDGGHKKNPYIRDTLSRFVDFVPVCPEVESGLPVPREPLRLVAGQRGVRLLGTRSGNDTTDRIVSFAEARLPGLGALDLDGFILKKDSPSCGLERVRIYPAAGDAPPSRDGAGIFASRLARRFPTLPLTEEGWLQDPELRESFLQRIYTHQRMRTTLFEEPSVAKLNAFHSEHKLLYMAHSPALYRDLGRLVAAAADQPLQDTLATYQAEAMTALSARATRGKQANVLQHIMGYFKESLASFEKRELVELIDDFREGLLDLMVPLTLLIHHVHKHEAGEWLGRQHYFHPYPRELTAR